MKKLYTLIAALFISFSSFAQADVEVFHHNLNNGDTLKIQNPLIGRIIAWGYVNHGPNPIMSTDTLFMQVKLLSGNNVYKLLLPSAGIPVGDTVNFVDTFAFSNGPANGTTVEWCDTVWVKRGTSVLADPVISNNKVCKTLNVKNTTVSVYDLFTRGKAGIAKLDVYPNPANNVIYFKHEFDGKNDAVVYVRDMVGRTIREERLGRLYGDRQVSVDMTSVPAGLYTVELVSGDFRSVGRILIQK